MVKKKQLLQQLPFATIAVLFFAPIFYIGVSGDFFYALICAAICSCASIFLCVSLRVINRRFVLYVFCALCLSLFALARFRSFSAPLFTLIPDNDIISLSGSARSSPIRTANGNYIVSFETESASSSKISGSASGRVQLLLNADFVEALYPGRLYSSALKGDGKTPPFIEQGAHFTVQVKPLTGGLFLVQKIGETGWKNHSDLIRALFRLQLKRVLYVWGGAGGFLLALLTGSREYLDGEFSQAFKTAGLSHILALSGMHLSLFGALGAYIARLVGGKKIAGCTALICMCVFVWFAGASPSLLRALICAVLLASASLCGLKASVLQALCASFIIQTVFFPLDAIQLSFMLSYAALFGIVTVGELLLAIVPLAKKIVSPIAASCGAQLCTSPISAVVFSCLTPIGIPASIAVSPVASFFLVSGVMCLLLSLAFPILLVPLGFIMRFLYEAVRLPVLFFARFPPIMF